MSDGASVSGAVASAVEPHELDLPPISAQTRERIEQARDRYPRPSSAILPALWAVQDQYGWLPPSGMVAVAEMLGLVPSEVQAVSTFYSMYFQHPAGRHHILVCVNTACALRGADDLCAYLERSLGVPSKGTTADGEFTWEATIECLGACGYAPMMQIDHIFHEFLTTPERIDAAVSSVRGTPAHGAHAAHAASPEREAGAKLAATSGKPAGSSVSAARRRPSIRDLDTGHSVPQASPTNAEVGAPPSEVPAPSVRNEPAAGEAGLLAESEVARKPGSPKVRGPMSDFTEQLAPGAVEGPERAPRDPAEAAEQRAEDRRRRRGRRSK